MMMCTVLYSTCCLQSINKHIISAFPPFLSALPEDQVRAADVRVRAGVHPGRGGEGARLRCQAGRVHGRRGQVRTAQPVRVSVREHRTHGVPAADGASRRRERRR